MIHRLEIWHVQCGAGMRYSGDAKHRAMVQYIHRANALSNMKVSMEKMSSINTDEQQDPEAKRLS